jgi:hypothetical protein
MIGSPVYFALAAALFSPSSGFELAFVSDPDGPRAVVSATLRAEKAGDGLVRFTYQARTLVLVDEGTTVAASADADFVAPPPIEGWPERDAMGMRWHDDGGVELWLAGSELTRLTTSRVRLQPVNLVNGGGAPLAVVSAVLTYRSMRYKGLAVVMSDDEGKARDLAHTGFVLVNMGRSGGLFSALEQNRFFNCSAEIGATPATNALALAYLDGVRTNKIFLPLAFRVTGARTSVLFSIAPSAQNGNPRSDVVAPSALMFVGDGFHEDRVVKFSAIVLPVRR